MYVIKNYYFHILVFLIIRYAWSRLFPSVPYDDNLIYYQIGQELENYWNFPSAARPLGYPILIYFVSFFDNQYSTLRFLNLLFYFISLYFLIYLLIKNNINRREILIFFVLFCISPSSIFSASLISPDAISLMLIIIIAYILSSDLNISKSLFLGISLAILSMIKPFFLLLLPFLFISSLILKLNYFKLKHVFIITLLFLIIYSPIIIRNYIAMGKFILATNNSGFILHAVHNKNSDAIDPTKYDRTIEKKLDLKNKNNLAESENQLKSYYTNEFLTYVKNNKLEFVTGYFFNIFKQYRDDQNMAIWSLIEIENDISAKKLGSYREIAMQVSNFHFYICFALFTIYLLFICIYKPKLNRFEIIYFLIIFYFTFLNAFFFASTRYHFLINPFIYYFASKIIYNYYEFIFSNKK